MAFTAGHPALQEHDITRSPPPAHVLSMGANLLTVAAAEHDVMVDPTENPHAESTHRSAPHASAPYRPPLMSPLPSPFDEW